MPGARSNSSKHRDRKTDLSTKIAASQNTEAGLCILSNFLLPWLGGALSHFLLSSNFYIKGNKREGGVECPRQFAKPMYNGQRENIWPSTFLKLAKGNECCDDISFGKEIVCHFR